MAPLRTPPSSILIVGSGVFGLGTAYSLAQKKEYEQTNITLIDRSPFPAPDGSSVDSSRIVRADYADIAYARLCLDAQDKWRNSWWGEDVYHEDGLAIAIKDSDDASQSNGLTGQRYMENSLKNVKRLGLKEGSLSTGGDVEVLPSSEAVSALFKQADGTRKGSFDTDMGYINRRSGWVDATGAMTNLRRKLEALNRVNFVTGQVKQLLYAPSPDGNKHHVTGVILNDSKTITADLTILATGAWTPSLLDLRGIASATGQVLGYIDLTPAEQAQLGTNPTILNESTGLFIITPSSSVLKVARHGYGYANPVRIANPEPRPLDPARAGTHDETIAVSLPFTSYNDAPPSSDPKSQHSSPPNPEAAIPPEATAAFRAFLGQTYPSLASRPFAQTRLCWYTDTPRSDWLVDYHPSYEGLFVATGGSGHAFKFAPVLGDAVVARLEGRGVGYGLDGKWGWPAAVRTGEGKRELGREGEGHVWADDWRGGRKGMVLSEEFGRAWRGKL